MAEPVWESALTNASADDAVVTIADFGPLAMIDFRLAADDDDGRAAIGAAIGIDLPDAPRSTATNGSRTALWLSIDQWLITGPAGERADMIGQLQGAAAGMFASVVDLSDARTVIRLEGAGAREIIMKGGAADLLAPEFRPGATRRLNFAGIAAMVHYFSADPETLDLYVFRSFADYAMKWLAAAAVPGSEPKLFRCAPPPPV